jgi:hypothetical protein
VLHNGDEIAHSGRKITAHTLKAIRAAAIDRIEIEAAELDGALTASDVIDLNTGEVIVEANVEFTADRLHKVLSSGAASFEVFFPERDDVGNIITNTLKRDSVRKPEEALIEIYRKLRPGDPPTLDTATALFEGMFFDARKYDFSRVGRLKFNIKLYENQDATHLDHRTLTPEDFYATIRYLLEAAPQHRHGGRHRSPGQPPRARRGRADGESVPHRPGPHGTRHQGKDERVSGAFDGHAARPDQRQAGDGGDSRVLRFLAACRSSWIRPTRSPRSRTSAACRHLGRAVCLANARASKSATCTRRTTAASVRLRRRKVRTSA